MATRAYKYRVLLTSHQEDRLDEVARRLRVIWNRGVRALRQSLWSIEHGRRSELINKLRESRASLKLVGARAAQVNKEVASGKTVEQAAKELDNRKLMRAVAINRHPKSGQRMLFAAHRRLAKECAMEDLRIFAPKVWFEGVSSSPYAELLRKFGDSVDRWVKSAVDSGIPRSKRRRDRVAVGFRTLGRFEVVEDGGRHFVDLSRAGGDHLSRCRIVLHRPLPDGAEVLNVRLTGSRGAWFVSVELKAPDEVFEIRGEATGLAFGVDPGMKAALTVVRSDDVGGRRPERFSPTEGMRNAERVQKLAARLSRKLDRQTRACNPSFFDDKGRWIKGRSSVGFVVSRGMIETQRRIAQVAMRVSDFRSQFYHRVANRLLAEGDLVAVGSFRPTDMAAKNKMGDPAPKGLGAARRARNRKAYSHAIGTFVGVLKDKARRYSVDKKVVDVNERFTTVTCPICNERTGPKSLDTRSWVCDKCGSDHDRDGAAAWNILQKGLS